MTRRTLQITTNDYTMKIEYDGQMIGPFTKLEIRFTKEDVRNIKVEWDGLNLKMKVARKTETLTTDAFSCISAQMRYDVEDNYQGHLNATLSCLFLVMRPEDAPNRRAWLFAREELRPLLSALLIYIVKRHEDDADITQPQ
jgi:hypothetical protein